MKRDIEDQTWLGDLQRWTIIAVGYFAFGKLGLLLAIEPGYATAVWPPSGIALAGILLFGYRVWPAVVVGSFLVNVSVPPDAATTEIMVKNAVVALSIGMGAGIQAVAGGALIGRFVGFDSTLDRVEEVLRFLVLAGPVACSVNASLGTTTLALAGATPASDLPFTWFTWWVGDVVGVIIFAPLILTCAAEPRALWRRRRFSVGIPMLLAFTVSIVAFFFASSTEQNRTRLEFERRADVLALSLQKGLSSYVDILHAVERFFVNSREVGPAAFGSFAQLPYERHPGIQALEWIPSVPDAQRGQFEDAARRSGYEGFQFTEREQQGQMVRAGSRGEYFPVYYVEPYAGNEMALWFDLASNPARLEALNLARDTGEPVATARITLVQEGGRQFAILVFVPVYESDERPETVDGRRANLRGFALGVFRIGDVVKASLENLDRSGVELRLYDDSAPEDARLLCVDREGVQSVEPIPDDDNVGLEWTSSFNLGSRRWSLQLVPTQEFMASRRSWDIWMVLVGGLFFTGMLGAFLLTVTGRTTRIEQLVEERTEELSEAHATLERHTRELERSNEELERFAYVASHDLQEPLRMVSSYVGLLEKRYKNRLDGDALDFIEFASDGAHRMSRLITDLLQFSRLDQKGESFQATNCEEVLDRALTKLEKEIGETETVVEREPLPMVVGDEEQLAVLFQNLIDNAIKFRAEVPPHIHISATSHDSIWQFEVRDNGIGIDPAYSDRIFQVFQRLHQRSEYAGNGIGLAMCRKIVERHDGEIWVDSEPSHGATFTFTLPKEDHGGP